VGAANGQGGFQVVLIEVAGEYVFLPVMLLVARARCRAAASVKVALAAALAWM
jgi:hypothetical protein